jgi:transposase
MAIKMSREEIRAVYRQGEEAVVTLIEMLIERLNTLEQEVERLKQQRSKDSRNSSKPPSSDMGRPSPRSLRKKSGKRPGAQPGHNGNSLKQVDNPDEIVHHRAEGMCSCGRCLGQAKVVGADCRQVLDIPPVRLRATEHRADIVECACGLQHVASFPAGVNAPVQYGMRLRAMITYLTNYQLLPQKRTTELMADLFGVSVSEGTVNNIQVEAYDRLATVEDAIKAALSAAPVAHADETGIYVGGKRLWEHTFGTDLFTYYFCHPKRGGEAPGSTGVLDEFLGRLVHDGWQPYFGFDVLHALCNAHHLRELIFQKEENKQKWAGSMIELLCRIKRRVDLARAAGRDSLAPATQRKYRLRYETIIKAGYRANPPPCEQRKPGQRGRTKQSSTRNLLDRLDRYVDETLAFMYDFRVPFDNNLSERDLRMTKVRQKVSGCFRSMAGARVFCRIRSYISTVRKHGHNTFEHLVNCFDYHNCSTVLLPQPLPKGPE